MTTTPDPQPTATPPVAATGATAYTPAHGWLAGDVSGDPQRARRFEVGIGGTIAFHVLLVALVLMWVTRPPAAKELPKPPDKMDIVYLQTPGPSGGGGGSPAPAPPKKLNIPKPKEPPKITPPPPVPVVPPPPESLTAPVITQPTDLLQAAGASSVSLADLGGGGSGGGIGSGHGNGLGPGEGGGFGGGVYSPGAGIVNPQLLAGCPASHVGPLCPQYTSEAMRAKISGTVVLEGIVTPEGKLVQIKVVRSLDREFGLDQEAMKAAALWRFKPGEKDGKPVNVKVTVMMDFTLR